MIAELLIATAMVMFTVLVHGAGLLGLSRVLRIEARVEAQEQLHSSPVRMLSFMLLLVFGLIVLHGIEIWSYALLFLLIGALPDLHTAVYYSTITYATIGYDDEGFSHTWQLVGAIEGVNGVILLGWSTAFLVTVFTRLRRW